jgi:UDP-glucose 4-epimerase
MLILVTGGTGYIGSHTCVELLDSGYDVIILDNLANSEREVVDRIAQITGKRPLFYHADATDATAVDLIFRTHAIDGVIHFAGLKAVGESVEKPLAYYKNNLLSTMVVLENCVKYGVKRFVFSSSATVYGENEAPLVESMELRPRANPYGETKAMCEKILTDTARIHPKMSVALLRYFNPVGATKAGLLARPPGAYPTTSCPTSPRWPRASCRSSRSSGTTIPPRTVRGCGTTSTLWTWSKDTWPPWRRRGLECISTT